MTVRIAKEKIEANIAEAKAKLTALGLDAKAESFYTDKNLDRSIEFNPKMILVFGNLTFGFPTAEEDDYCNFSICCELKSGEVSDEELEKSIRDFQEEVDTLISTLANATSKEKVLEDLAKKQTDDATVAAAEFDKEMRKVKLKLTLAIAVIVVIILGVIIGGSLLN